MNDKQPSRRKAQSGFSLIELVMTVAIFTIVTGAVYGLLAAGRSDTFTTKQRIEMMQNVRVATETMGRDALNAGIGFPRNGAVIPDNRLTLFGLTADGDTDLDRITPVISGDNLNANAINPVAGTMTDQITFLFQDDLFNNGTPVDVASISGNQQLRLAASVTATSLCAVGDIYIVWGPNAAMAMVTSVPGGANNAVNCAIGDPLSINTTAATGPLGQLGANATTLYKLSMATYYVTSDGTLMRRMWGNPTALVGTGATPAVGPTGYLDEPLAYGVENMQISYVLAPDGVVVTNPTAAQRTNIRQVEITISVRSPEVDKTGQPFRTSLTSRFSTRNLVYSKQLGGGS